MGLIIWALLLWSSFGHAEAQSCLPNFTALQVIDKNPASHEFSYSLISDNGKGLFVSKVQLVGNYTSDRHILNLRVEFDPKFSGVSLPYNLYAILILQNGVPVLWRDFSESCQSPGVGFFPGQVFRLPSIQLPAGQGPLQLMVWGRL